MKTRKIIISILIIVVVGLFAGCAYFYHTISTVANAKTICKGVQIDGVDVGGMTKKEAKEKVSAHEEELTNKNVTIAYEDHTDVVPLNTIGYQYEDIDTIVEEAYKIGKEGSVWKRYKAIREGAGKGENLVVQKEVTEDGMQAFLDKHEDDFVKVAKDATMVRENGAFVITDEQKGMEVPTSDNVKAINKYLNKSWKQEDFTYDLIAKTAEPKYTREDMEKCQSVLGTFTTNFSTSGFNRITNIKNACSKINGSMLYPGETFSVMDKILPFTADNGYLEAGSYSRGEVIQSYGGGVCQVSTTLYNAVLLSELDVKERHNHQMFVTYVKLSMDAAVSDTGNQDFKFENNLEKPIYIDGYVDGYNITFTIYGEETRDPNRKIEYESETTQTIEPGKDIETKDKNMEEGKKEVTQSAHIGYRAKLWKKIYENGELTDTQEVNNSYYAPSPRRVTVGTKKKDDKDKDKDKNKDSKDNKNDNASESKPSDTTQATDEKTTTQATATTEKAATTEAVPTTTEADKAE